MVWSVSDYLLGSKKAIFFLSISLLFLYSVVYQTHPPTKKKEGKKGTQTSSVIYYRSMAALVHILKKLSYWLAAEATEKHKQAFLIR